MLVVKENDLQEIAQRGAEAALRIIEPRLLSPFPEVMTIKQVAGYLGFSEPTIRKLMDEKGLPYSRRCGDPRFYKPDVDAWLTEKK